MLAIRDGSEAKFGSGYNVLPVWKKRIDAKAIIPTPNADATGLDRGRHEAGLEDGFSGQTLRRSS
jgi:hypothetical protein